MASSESSAATLAALIEASHRRLKAHARGKSGSDSSVAASRAKSTGRGPFHAEERLQRRRELSASAPVLRGVAAAGRPVLLRERRKHLASHAKAPSSASVRSASTDKRSIRSASTDNRQARGVNSGAIHSKLPWRWFEAASEAVDRDGSRVGSTASVMSGRRFAGYVTHRPLRPRSADPVLSSATDYSTSFVDASHRTDVLQACETVYTREKRRDALFHAAGGDPRRALTAASLNAEYGVTDYQKSMQWRTSDDIAIAIGTSPDIETARRDTEEAYRRVAERQLQELSLMEAARVAALSERRAQSARAYSSRVPARSRSESSQLLLAELRKCEDQDQDLAHELQLAKKRMLLRAESGYHSARERTPSVGSSAKALAHDLETQSRMKHSRQLIEQPSATTEVDLHIDSSVEKVSRKSREFEPMSALEWANLARCKYPVDEQSISRCSTAASSHCSSIAKEPLTRSRLREFQKSLQTRPRSAGAPTALPDSLSEREAVSVTAYDDNSLADATEDDILRAIDNLCNKYCQARQSGSRSNASNASAARAASTRRRPSSAVGRLQSVSESALPAKMKDNEPTKESLNLLDEILSKPSMHQKRQSSGSSIGVRDIPNSVAPMSVAAASSRRRPASAVARMQTGGTERTGSAKTQASCGSAHQAVRAARQRPSSAGATRSQKKKS